MKWLSQAVRSAVTYSTSAVYISGLVLFALAVGGYLDYLFAVLLFSLIYMLSILFGMRKEMRQVHVLVNSQRDELLDRMERMVDLLDSAGIAVPETHRRGSQEVLDETKDH